MTDTAYPKVRLLIDGEWTDGTSGKSQDILNPATGQSIGTVPHASKADLDRALNAAQKGFDQWKKVSAFERYKTMRKVADIMRQRAPDTAKIMSLEQGKPVGEALLETNLAADLIDWFAEEARRTYGRIVPARMSNIEQLVIKEPVGPVAAFTPWNFPINQAVRKVSAAVAAGCSIIVKGPEDTPASCAELFRAYVDGGVPAGVVNLVFGVPHEVSEYLIPHPVIRKISFTGSTVVGKHLASLAGQHMKRVTMELGGHAPAIVFDDADIKAAVSILATNKFRNAGQVCVAPTRFLVQDGVYNEFLAQFVETVRAIKVGPGIDPNSKMGALVSQRRVDAMEGFVADAVQHGAVIETGGKRMGNEGFFFEPTVLTNVSKDSRIMNEEPFGPLAPVSRFSSYEEVVSEANRLPYGLAAYAYTRSAKTAAALSQDVESGMLSINHHGLSLPEVPFGGMKDSGYGSEGGLEAIEGYLSTKFVTQANV